MLLCLAWDKAVCTFHIPASQVIPLGVSVLCGQSQILLCKDKMPLLAPGSNAQHGPAALQSQQPSSAEPQLFPPIPGSLLYSEACSICREQPRLWHRAQAGERGLTSTILLQTWAPSTAPLLLAPSLSMKPGTKCPSTQRLAPHYLQRGHCLWKMQCSPVSLHIPAC